ncbi:MAG: ABC transporter permease [Deferribacteres bacterium]|nr:ABC transporter permease [Deferribacteres bacterium]
MFRSFLNIALRNLRNNKAFSVINIAGLAVGLASFIFIVAFIKSELSYEDFHQNADRIYRPVGVFNRPGMGRVHNGVTPGALGPALASDFAQIEKTVRLRPLFDAYFQVGDNGFYESAIAMTDTSIFDIFTIPLKYGDPKTALSNINSLVIDTELAEKYFGDIDPVGRTITVSASNRTEAYTVTAVMEKYPENSHLFFRALGSIAALERDKPALNGFNTNMLATYVLLREGADIADVQQGMQGFIDKNVPDREESKLEQWYFQPLNDIHLRSGHLLYQTYNRNQGDIQTVYLFSAIAVLVLLIASINFMNLSTARSARRAKEVGLRKVVGSARKHLIYQFVGESVLIALLGLLGAALLVLVSTPFFEHIFDGTFSTGLLSAPVFWLQIIGIALLIGLLSGTYPAFFLSAYKPSETLKGNFATGSRGVRLRKTLVLTQFAIAVALIICTGGVGDQMNYIRGKDLGFNQNQVMYVPLRSPDARERLPVLKSELLKNPQILRTAAAAGIRGASGSNGMMTVAGSNGEQQLMTRFSAIDHDFLELMEMKLVQGRNFRPGSASDSNDAVIINETAARELGWQDAVGKEFVGSGEGETVQVIGVVNDYHFFSLRSKIEPQLMYIGPNSYQYLLLKINPRNMSETLSFVESTWRKLVPGRPFEHGFLDENFDRSYRAEERTGRLFTAFSALAIFIACLGLFGLASFTVEQKSKEIGIRKVLGASVPGIVAQLSKDFAKWVIIASLLAFPFAYWMMESWLANFVYRTSQQPLTFALATVLVIVIALLTVSMQAVRAALSNPIDTLRSE